MRIAKTFCYYSNFNLFLNLITYCVWRNNFFYEILELLSEYSFVNDVVMNIFRLFLENKISIWTTRIKKGEK